MSRTRRLVKGAGLGYLHQAAVILLGLWLTPFLLRHVGQHELGLWLVAGQILGYLGLMDLGVLAILPREVAVASGSTEGVAPGGLIAQLVAQVRGIVRLQVIGLAIACTAVIWWLPGEWSELAVPLLFVFGAFVALYPLRVVTAVLQGMQELPFLSKMQLVGWAASSTLTVALVLMGVRLHALTIGWTIGAAIPAFAAWRYVRAKWPHVLAMRGNQPVGPYFRRSLWVSVSQIAQVLLNGSDILLLGRLLGPAAVVPYACTGKLVTVFSNHPHLLMHAAQPALSELRASSSKERLANVATALTHAMLMMSGALTVVIVAANHFFVNWWVGSNQYGGWPLTLAFVTMMLLRHWNVATIYTLFCFGYERQISLTSLADGLVSVVGTLVFVWQWGPIGAPLASIASVLCVSLPLNVRSVAHEMELSVGGFLARIAPLVLRVVPVAALAAVGGALTSGHSLLETIFLVGGIALLYALVVVPLAWSGPVGPYVRLAWPALEQVIGTPGSVNRLSLLERCRLAFARTRQG